MDKNTPTQPNWQDMLHKAVTEPGTISTAYSKFWNYSLGNQMLALIQCYQRHIPVGPIASFNGWRDQGRHVKKGEKAIALCMPVTMKRTERDSSTGEEKDHVFNRFIFRNNWFVLSQTDGAEYKPDPIPDWDRETALNILEITEQPFEHTNGNVQGYAAPGRKIAINPIAALPHKTTFHEIAHILMHSEEAMVADGETTPRTLKEAEAEAVALLCLESLGLPGAEFCRGYIQEWLGNSQIPEKSAQKIFHTADLILRAGRIKLN